MLKRVWLFLFLCLPSSAAAQVPEIVPAEDPVYDFLHLMRVKGLLPEYQHEIRPISRGEVIRHLESLHPERNALGQTAWAWLQTFRQAFLEPKDQLETVLTKGTGNEAGQTKLQLPLGKDTEKFFYYQNDETWRFVAELKGSAQFRTAKEEEDGFHGVAGKAEIGLQGHYKEHLGFYSYTFNGWQLSERAQRQALRYDPDLRNLYYISYYANRNIPPEGSFDRTSASLRYEQKPFFAEIANERLNVGAGFSDPLVLASDADYFSFVRLGLRTKKAHYQVIHGRLGQPARYLNTPEAFMNTAAQRYLGIHRIQFQPKPSYSISFSEMVIYANRSPEIGYLNPFYPYKTSEHAQWDQDNTLFQVETVLRPMPNLETHASFVADDLNFGQIGKNSHHVKWAFQTGAGLNIGDQWLASLEYTRVEPFTFTHRFQQNGYFFNAYEHNGFALSHPIGPNSDQWLLRLRGWFPYRIRGDFRLAYNRHGANATDAAGQVINTGGDLRNGAITDEAMNTTQKQFLGGILNKGMSSSLSIIWEPIRQIEVRGYGYLQTWDKSPNLEFARLELVFDF